MAVIEVRRLTKQFGRVTAVDELSFEIGPGVLTGFLGPNGAGKTTTLRMLLGLERPTSGQATLWGMRYAELGDRRHKVGALLEASGFHPGRTVRDHLRVRCAASGLPRSNSCIPGPERLSRSGPRRRPRVARRWKPRVPVSRSSPRTGWR